MHLASGEVARVLDLGAGTGLLAARLRAAFPAAELTLLDGAGRMLELARERLGEDGVRYLEGDMAGALPAGPWDAVVSSLAVHHLSDADKRALNRRVLAGLRPGGVFVNAEQVAAPTPWLAGVYARWHEARARAAGTGDAEWEATLERMSYDRCAPVAAQLGWLREAGFADVDCLFKRYHFAVLFARRP